MNQITKNFNRSEFDCKCGCGTNNIDIDFVKSLQEARDRSRVPYNINSGCRCYERNARIGGTLFSSHLKGLAADIETKDQHERFLILGDLLYVGFHRLGVYPGFIHVDADQKKAPEIVWL